MQVLCDPNAFTFHLVAALDPFEGKFVAMAQAKDHGGKTGGIFAGIEADQTNLKARFKASNIFTQLKVLVMS